MTEYEIPTHMRLYVDAIRALPLPDSRGTVDCMRKAEDAGIFVRPIKPMAVHDDPEVSR